jgi:predicted PurR-regulated permease PerM
MNENSSTDEHPRLRWPRWLPWLIAVCVILVIYRLGSEIIGEAAQALRPVLVPLLLSVAFAYLLDPLVEWLPTRWKLGREIAASIAILIGGLVLLVAVLFVIPPVVAQLIESAQKVPDAIRSGTEAVRPYLERFHARYPAAYEDIVKRISASLQAPAINQEQVVGFLGAGLGQVASATINILNIILIPFFTFYILRDLHQARQSLERLIPPRFRPRATHVFDRLGQVTSNFVRGQLTVAAILSVLYSLGFLLVGAPLPLSLGVLAGFGYLIPYLGAFIAVMLALLLTLLKNPGWWSVISVLGVYFIVHTIEGFVLTPRILGERLQLHPMLVIVGLIIGGSLFGILGIILALPVMAILKVIFEALLEPYLQSSFYTRQIPQPAVGQPDKKEAVQVQV